MTESLIQLRFGTRGEPPKSAISNPRKTVDDFVEEFRRAKEIVAVKERESKFLTGINKFSEVFEVAEDEYLSNHPDPFDERAPFSIVPDCSLGKLQKNLSEYPEFLDEVIEDCILRATCKDLQKATCRLLLLTLPGFEAAATFSSFGDRLIPKLHSWAELPLSNPLSGYAAGFLGHAMESSDLVSDYRTINQRLVPVVIRRLQEAVENLRPRPFPHSSSPPSKRMRHSTLEIYDDSDSRGSFTSEADLRQEHKLHPLGNPRKIVLYLQYLTPMGEYFDQLPSFMEHDALGTVLDLLDIGDNIMKLETLKLLSSMLCHNKVALDFVNRSGLERLTSVSKSSRAGAAVAVCLYYLAYNGDVMERFFQISREKMRGVISYALDLIEVKHDSARVHSIMFFTYILLNPKNRVMLQIFDEKDGVRRIFNVISTMSVLQNGDIEDQESHAEKTSCKMASVCLKRYIERNIVLKAEALGINTALYQLESNTQSTGKKMSLYDLAEKINNYGTGCFLSKMGFLRKFIHMKCIRTLLRLALRCADWTGFTGRIETIRALIDIVAICSLSFEAIMQLCEPIVSEDFFESAIQFRTQAPPADLDSRHPSDDHRNCGLSLLLLMVEDNSEDGHFFSEDIRASALDILKSACYVSPRRKASEVVFGVLQKNHGIQILINLMDNPALRIGATIALAGIARLDHVKQIVRKVLQPKHIVRQFFLGDSSNLEDFQRALNHLSDISGMPKYSSETWDIEKITRRNEILKNTKILVDQKEILQLVEAHLREAGLPQTAEMLRNEAGISSMNYKSAFKTPRQRTSSFDENALPTPRCTALSEISTNVSPQKPTQPKIRFSNASRSQNSLTFSKTVLPPNVPAKQEESEEPEILFSLTDAVRSYFREQWHAKCKNPISSCPRFSIYKQHKCPEKRPDPTPVPLPIRLRSRKIKNYRAGDRGNILDKQFVWNRFRSMPVNIRTPADQHATACALSTNENLLIVGSTNGDVLMYDTNTDHNQAAYNCCENAIIHIGVTERFVTTTQRYGSHPTTLWSFPDMDIVKDFEDPAVIWGEFAKHSNRLALTCEKECILYDVETDKALLNIPYIDLGCGYEQNRTFFGPGDDVFLSDGCLWDLRSGKKITRFDKLNQNVSGIFHPTQPHVIISSEIWDIRMVDSNRILKQVPELRGIWPRFTPRSDAMFAAKWFSDIENQDIYELDSVIKIYDPMDYENLGTWKFESNRSKIPRRKVLDFTMNKSERMVNVLESDMSKHVQTNCVSARWYQIGMLQDDDDEESDNASDNSDNDYGGMGRRPHRDEMDDFTDEEGSDYEIYEGPRLGLGHQSRRSVSIRASTPPSQRPSDVLNRDTRIVSLRESPLDPVVNAMQQANREREIQVPPSINRSPSIPDVIPDDGDEDWEDIEEEQGESEGSA